MGVTPFYSDKHPYHTIFTVKMKDTTWEILFNRKFRRNFLLSHDHPSNGWLAPGYKPVLLGRRLKALAFSLGYENAAYTAFPQLRSSHIAFDSSLPLKGYCYYLALTLKRVFKFLYTQFIQCNVMFLLVLNVLSYSCFIQPYCTNIISFSPEMTIPKFIL